MELTVRPEDLAAAGARLAQVADRLDEVRATLVRRTGSAADALGDEAATAAASTGEAAGAAIRAVQHDTGELARALRVLAVLYADVDAAG